MATEELEWRPGSFTKNFGWGERNHGLRQLHESIRIGFDNEMQDVPRSRFSERVKQSGRIDLIPMNFFLFNRKIDGVDYLSADELVFQALTAAHSPSFDKLALFIFNFSYVGTWSGAYRYQRRPALWAYHYIKDRVVDQYRWDTASVTADDIENFVSGDSRYVAQSARKLATNLNYLYSIARLSEFAERRVERWWVDAVFLALDRLIEDRELSGGRIREARYQAALSEAGFRSIAGQSSLEKDFAEAHLTALYRACGSRDRFYDDRVMEKAAHELPDEMRFAPNDLRPQGAVHPTNPRILKIIPRACAALARHAGFKIIDADDLAAFDVGEFIREQTDNGLNTLMEHQIRPTMSAEELMKMTRER